MKKDALITLDNVSKIYKTEAETLYALNGVSLSISKNDFVTIIGPSGSGKSTMLHILGLLDLPSDGTLYLDGVNPSTLSEASIAYLRGKKIGFVFQTFHLIPSLTVLQNVALPALIYDANEEEANSRAASILRRMGMADRLQHHPNQLSGGQKQRVAIARALINDPEVILADEPTGNLDSKTGAEVLELFKELHSEGKTIIIITHDLSITKMAKTVLKIKDGKLVR